MSEQADESLSTPLEETNLSAPKNLEDCYVQGRQNDNVTVLAERSINLQAKG